MYVRIVQTRIKPGSLAAVQDLYNRKSIPKLRKVPGCLCATLIHGEQEDTVISLTLWASQEHLKSYEKSRLHQELLREARVYLADSVEWKVQLSEDYTLDYEAVHEEPVVKSLPVVLQTSKDLCDTAPSRETCTRIVSVKILPDKMHEFRELYAQEILPAIQAVKGCRQAFLAEGDAAEKEIYSITIWDSREDVERYEQSGLFERLTEKVRHTFSELHEWQVLLARDFDQAAVTKEVLKVNCYRVVTGMKFRQE